MILIIAYGNSLRRDDGAGFFLGAQLKEHLQSQCREVECIAVHQLTPELAIDVAAETVQAVVFVDTRMADTKHGSLALQVRFLQDLPGFSLLGHQLSPEVVLAYAHLLYAHRPFAWLITIPGIDFDHGEGLSETAERAIATLPDFLVTLSPDWPLEKDQG
jgi:hydrogenase maturation protease